MGLVSVVMGEADWWLCDGCQSLNNLSARKCYSCRRHKPRSAARASELLGYVPVVSWDGRVSFQGVERSESVAAEPGPLRPPPLRDPVRRDTLAVAPRPPDGARITYQLAGASAPPPAGPARPTARDSRPLVGVGPGPAPTPSESSRSVPLRPVNGRSQQWPHWRDLLDGPRPEGQRLRAAYAADANAPSETARATAQSGALSQAMRGAREGGTERSRPFVPWPPSDRPAARSES